MAYCICCWSWAPMVRMMKAVVSQMPPMMMTQQNL